MIWALELVGLQGNDGRLRCKLVQQLQLLCLNYRRNQAYACNIAARAAEAGDETSRNRVSIKDADDGNRRRCGLGRKRRDRTTRRGDYGHPTTHQIGREHR
jgi:hypothetical protein